jgi:sugar lactone lactonase YvrE
MLAGEEPRPGDITLVTPDGTARKVADGVLFPNGMAVTEDDSTLIVADSYGTSLLGFEIRPDGSLSEGRLWADLGEAPDGICVDAEGAVWYATVPGRRCVRVREGGEILQTVDLDRGGFACVLGGPDGRTLFVVAAEWLGTEVMVRPGSGRVLAVDVTVPGAGRP